VRLTNYFGRRARSRAFAPRARSFSNACAWRRQRGRGSRCLERDG